MTVSEKCSRGVPNRRCFGRRLAARARHAGPVGKSRLNQSRWFDPTVGRWLSEDPSGLAAGDPNLYRYCGNAPTDAADASGLQPARSAAPGAPNSVAPNPASGAYVPPEYEYTPIDAIELPQYVPPEYQYRPPGYDYVPPEYAAPNLEPTPDFSPPGLPDPGDFPPPSFIKFQPPSITLPSLEPVSPVEHLPFTLKLEQHLFSPGYWGAFSYPIDWHLSPVAPEIQGTNATQFAKAIKEHASGYWPRGSWIVQHVHALFDVVTRIGGTITTVHIPADDHWNYLEAWPVLPGRTANSLPGLTTVVADTYWLTKAEVTVDDRRADQDTCGTITFIASACFYSNILLPAAFTRLNPETHAHELPATTDLEAMANIQPSSPSVNHNLIVNWTTPIGKTTRYKGLPAKVS